MNQIYDRVALIGLGLIASSIFWSSKRNDVSAYFTGFSRSERTRNIARNIGLCDEVVDSLKDAVKNADLIILCVPVGAMEQVMFRIAPFLKPGVTISDVGSVKRAVINAVEPHLPAHVKFVPAHPLAGTEHSGPESGFASLFDNRWCLLTDHESADKKAQNKVMSFWKSLGANVEFMDADHHDLVLAVTSHAPHLIAYTMVGVADDLGKVTDSEVIKYSAAGFRDFTRIAASDPVMWRDVFLSNKEATLEILGRFTEELFDLQRAIRTGNGEKLLNYFNHTRSVRREIIEAGQDIDAPNFGRNMEPDVD